MDPKRSSRYWREDSLNKWSVVAIAVDKRERPAMVHAFHNY